MISTKWTLKYIESSFYPGISVFLPSISTIDSSNQGLLLAYSVASGLMYVHLGPYLLAHPKYVHTYTDHLLLEIKDR